NPNCSKRTGTNGKRTGSNRHKARQSHGRKRRCDCRVKSMRCGNRTMSCRRSWRKRSPGGNLVLDEGRLAAKRITYPSMRKTSLVTLILIGCYCVPSLVRAQETVMATINGQDEYRISGSTECGGE